VFIPGWSKPNIHERQVGVIRRWRRQRSLLETSEGLRTAGQNYDATDTEAAGHLRRAGNANLSALGG
jgi:hypothetical protein